MIWYFVVGINVIAVIIFIFLVLHYKKKWEGIKHYEKIRDKLTVREEELEEEDTEGYSFPIGNLIGGFIVIIIGVNLIGTIADEVNQTMNATSIGLSASQTILDIVPVFFGLAIIMAGIGLAIGGLRRGGLV